MSANLGLVVHTAQGDAHELAAWLVRSYLQQDHDVFFVLHRQPSGIGCALGGTAAARIGVEPKDGVVFEDALVGIAAAKAAGCRVVAVATTEPKEKLAHADWVVSQLDALTVEQLWG